MTDQDQARDPWEEFDRLPPAGPDRVEGLPGGQPLGFGFRTGVRSAKVAIGFAVYALILGTVLVLTGAIVFISEGQWLLLALMVKIEAVFVIAYSQLVRQDRNRRSAQYLDPVTPPRSSALSIAVAAAPAALQYFTHASPPRHVRRRRPP
jgi:hypothetical protein